MYQVIFVILVTSIVIVLYTDTFCNFNSVNYSQFKTILTITITR